MLGTTTGASICINQRAKINGTSPRTCNNVWIYTLKISTWITKSGSLEMQLITAFHGLSFQIKVFWCCLGIYAWNVRAFGALPHESRWSLWSLLGRWTFLIVEKGGDGIIEYSYKSSSVYVCLISFVIWLDYLLIYYILYIIYFDMYVSYVYVVSLNVYLCTYTWYESAKYTALYQRHHNPLNGNL